jgi:DNA-binding NarL/FixJ family response regulator
MSDDKSKLRILLADDHGVVREGLCLLINRQPDMECIAEADNGREAVRLALELVPDVAVLDISMPELNGLQATKVIKQASPQIIILTLTRHTEEAFLQQLLGAGASGYVLKQSPSAEIIYAIRTVAAGNAYLDPAVTEKVIGGFVGRHTERAKDAPPPALTDREAKVLRLIARGYQTKEIAHKLNISVKTVEAHKANALQKLGLHSRVDIVRYAILRDWLHND